PWRSAKAAIQRGYRSAETSNHLTSRPVTFFTTHCPFVFTVSQRLVPGGHKLATTAQDQTGTTPLNEDVFMLPIDPGDGPGSVTPAQPLHDIVPFQAMAYGGTIIRPGAVAGGGTRNARDGGHVSCEVIERALATVARDPGELPWLMTELAASRLWVPLP